MKRAFKIKQKIFFISFKGLSMKQIMQILLKGEGPTLILTYLGIKMNLASLSFFVHLKHDNFKVR